MVEQAAGRSCRPYRASRRQIPMRPSTGNRASSAPSSANITPTIFVLPAYADKARIQSCRFGIRKQSYLHIVHSGRGHGGRIGDDHIGLHRKVARNSTGRPPSCYLGDGCAHHLVGSAPSAPIAASFRSMMSAPCASATSASSAPVTLASSKVTATLPAPARAADCEQASRRRATRIRRCCREGPRSLRQADDRCRRHERRGHIEDQVGHLLHRAGDRRTRLRCGRRGANRSRRKHANSAPALRRDRSDIDDREAAGLREPLAQLVASPGEARLLVRARATHRSFQAGIDQFKIEDCDAWRRRKRSTRRHRAAARPSKAATGHATDMPLGTHEPRKFPHSHD